MKNNIIKDDREISIKAESFLTDGDDDAKSIEEPLLLTIATDDINLLTEPSEMNTETLTDPTVPMMTDNDPIIEPAQDGQSIMNTETLPDPTAPMMIDNDPIIEPVQEEQSIQSELTAFVENVTATTTELFKNNRQLFITLGWLVLAILGIKIVFATLGIIDDIPLVTPIIKLVGLVSVVRFAWRYLIREHDRKELVEIIDRTKVEVLGDRQPLS
ncbi:MAG: CAAD domain-containing protein [Chamaesiphon sp.]|nr:CAAD domain-containing protein [Chamaesiphon sp.]